MEKLINLDLKNNKYIFSVINLSTEEISYEYFLDTISTEKNVTKSELFKNFIFDIEEKIEINITIHNYKLGFGKAVRPNDNQLEEIENNFYEFTNSANLKLTKGETFKIYTKKGDGFHENCGY